MKYKYVIFDLDGTLLDTLDDLADSVNATLTEYSFDTVNREHVRRSIGNGVGLLMKRSLPNGTSDELCEECTDFFRRHYAENCENKTRPYDGIPKLLLKLRQNGIGTAVVSNKFDGAVKRLCKKYFDGLIELAIGERDGVARKPSPDSVFAAVSELGGDIARDRILYVGDSDVDVLTAKHAGVDCAAVTWGFRDRDVLLNAGATLLADDCAQLENIIFGKN